MENSVEVAITRVDDGNQLTIASKSQTDAIEGGLVKGGDWYVACGMSEVLSKLTSNENAMDIMVESMSLLMEWDEQPKVSDELDDALVDISDALTKYMKVRIKERDERIAEIEEQAAKLAINKRRS